jgi:prepilin-type N-terminal cleavage/methylation domain-containing protein
MHVSFTARRARRGFTLVEMLVVIAIIGILAGLITAAAYTALKKARETAITVEFTQMDMALKAYKDKYGEYPPDGTDRTDANNNGVPDSFERHFSRVFPNANLASQPYALSELGILSANCKFPCDPSNAGTLRQFFANYTPATALVFWLGGMQEDDYSANPGKNPSSRLMGFSSDPVHPLSGLPTASRQPMWYEFDLTRVRDPSGATVSNTIFRHYLGNANVPQPYAYFRAEINQRSWEYCQNIPRKDVKFFGNDPNHLVHPYFDATQATSTMPGAWINPSSYQLLFCGFDNTFGFGNWYPIGKWTTTPSVLAPANWRFIFFPYDDPNDTTNPRRPSGYYNDDDITNFAAGRIDSKKP